VLEICERWQGNSAGTNWIIKHACRSLLKKAIQGHAAVRICQPAPDVRRKPAIFNHLTKVGDEISFGFDLRLETKKMQKLRLNTLYIS
jgi:hypothetical protein